MILDFSNIFIDQLITHWVGNKGLDEKLKLSEIETDIKDDTLDFVIRYFFAGLNTDECYNFWHPVEVQMNDVLQIVQKLFRTNKRFIENSQAIANLLYQCSTHPKIKSGELNIARISNLIVNGKTVQAIGIYKSENPLPFLKMHSKQSQYTIRHESGYHLDKIDKGCLILDNGNDNYQVLLGNTQPKKEEAQYWKDAFLQVKPLNDSYHYTNNVLSVTKNFITEELPKLELGKKEQIEYLNRSVEYFKQNETFNINTFQEQVFNDTGIIERFQQFGSSFTAINDIEIAGSFDISAQALRKQQRIFKSVLKLDKNFHVYIHGNTELIEKGFDEKKGKHFYKIYFDQEQ